jgi:hypothetical protein
MGSTTRRRKALRKIVSEYRERRRVIAGTTRVYHTNVLPFRKAGRVISRQVTVAGNQRDVAKPLRRR